MVKWFRLFGDQYLGFWMLGLLLFMIQEIPYMVMPLFHLESNPIMNMQESSVVLNFCEKLLGSLCIAFMTFIIQENAVLFSIGDTRERIFFTLAVVVLLLNFIGWGFYFVGYQNLFVMMFFIVLLPPLYYVFIGLWRNNMILTISGGLFLMVHFSHVLSCMRITLI